MSHLKDVFQDIQPVTLHLAEESATSRLYCSTAEGMEAQVSTLVEAFLVEVYRCRVCQFTSSLKARISTHVAERHDLGRACQRPLSCLGKDDGESLDVEVGVADGELDSSSSPYGLEDELHSGAKDGEDHIDHMGLERMSFLLPMYSMLHNISPQSCDMGLGSNSDGGLHVAHTCEVSTLFEEEEGEAEQEPAEFRLEDGGSVELPGPLPYPMDSVGPGAQDEEMAQSAHLMSLGLCRISNMKCLPRSGTPEPRSSPAPERSRDADVPQAEEPRGPAAAAGVPKLPGAGRGPSCVLCRASLTSRSQLELHLRCHAGERGFRCPRCGWESPAWGKMERHWRAHGRRGGGRPHRCPLCARAFRTVEARDAHRRRHARRRGDPVRCARCPVWCRSPQERELHARCHAQGGFKCLHCGFRDQSWDSVRRHMLTEHSPLQGQQAGPETSSSSTCPQRGVESAEAGPEAGRGQRKRRPRGWRKGGLQNGDGDGDGGGGGATEGEAPRIAKRARGRKEFCCSLCDRKFSTKLSLRRHMGIHRGEKPYQCPQCPYNTRLKASLVQHLRVHTGEKPFKCTQCPYASIDGSSLRRHARTHTQEKPHHCQHCSYSSIQKKSLDLHVRRHHTGESFPCHLCRYSTPDRQLLHRHLRRTHSSDSLAQRPRPHSPPSGGGAAPAPSSPALSLRMSPLHHTPSPLHHTPSPLHHTPSPSS
ncbi:zinc finger protein 668 [Conger conger]|uniref:zinc finger protein 668 n=1 Tax=Conger conger TaxID=82655 RepID=UPI002A59888B|nr:zinc finger protein 668 [Conger conger]